MVPSSSPPDRGHSPCKDRNWDKILVVKVFKNLVSGEKMIIMRKQTIEVAFLHRIDFAQRTGRFNIIRRTRRDKFYLEMRLRFCPVTFTNNSFVDVLQSIHCSFESQIFWLIWIWKVKCWRKQFPFFASRHPTTTEQWDQLRDGCREERDSKQNILSLFKNHIKWYSFVYISMERSFFCSLKYLMKKRGGENVWKLKKSLHLDKHMFLMWKESELLCPCHHTYYLPISNNSFSLPLPWKLCFRFFVLAPPHRWNQRLCKNINHRDSSFVLSKLSSILGCWVVRQAALAHWAGPCIARHWYWSPLWCFYWYCTDILVQ